VGGAARGRAMSFDVIRAIEACYAPVEEEAAWLAGIGEAMKPLHQGMGGAVLTYDARDPAAFQIGGLVATGVGPEFGEMLELFHRQAGKERIRALYGRPPPCGSLLATLPSMGPEMAGFAHRYLSEAGFPNIYAVHGAEPDHRGAIAGFNVRVDWRPPPPIRHRLSHMSAHLCTAFRLRRAIGGLATPDSGRTEAVLDPSGRVEDARGAAQDPAARASLGVALRRVERARGRARRASPEEAVDLWRGLVDGTWSLVDHVESGGRRYVLAVRNPPGVLDPRALTARERDIVGFALMGRSNKWIGYTLGLAASTVAEHLARVLRKLGARSRTGLILALGPGS